MGEYIVIGLKIFFIFLSNGTRANSVYLTVSNLVSIFMGVRSGRYLFLHGSKTVLICIQIF